MTEWLNLFVGVAAKIPAPLCVFNPTTILHFRPERNVIITCMLNFDKRHEVSRLV